MYIVCVLYIGSSSIKQLIEEQKAENLPPTIRIQPLSGQIASNFCL